jgi:predicted dehydrogenase
MVSTGRVLAANARLGVGFIGVGGRGRTHLDIALGLINQGENLKIVAVSDTYGPRLRANAEHAQAKPYRDYRELLADKTVDVVCIATPDRLHVPQALEAIRAGKDVYCEKPMGHWSQFALSKKFFEETRKLGRVVQIGNQANSSGAWKKVTDLVQKGAIGRVQHVAAGYYRRGDWGERMPIPDRNAQPGPDLDWEGFLGDAPKVPFSVERFFSWRMFLDYAGGPCTDLFPHVLTPFISALGLKFPTLAVGTGGIFKFDNYGREVPDTFNMLMDYPERLSVNLVCTLSNEFNSDPVIRGDEGTIELKGTDFGAGFQSIKLYPAKGEPSEIKGEIPNSTVAHWQNFLQCVRTRAKPVSDVEFGLYVQAAMCMSMLSYLNKKVARFDFEKQEILL